MHRKISKCMLVLLIAVFACCCVMLAACNRNKGGYNGLFAGQSHDYILTSDYNLTDADVRATKGSGDVTLDYICSFDLGGHTLNLGGYSLNVTSASNEIVKFTNGKIVNGRLNISVPNGDIEFKNTNIDKSVTYELEAASETIRFSNAVVSGKCTVKSNSNVKIEYSDVDDIVLSGSGTLTAGNGSSLGTVTVSEAASGAKVNVTQSSSVQNMQLEAAAKVSVSGSVSSVVVEETAKNDSANLSINIERSAQVDKVWLNSAATVSVAGSVQAVIVAEKAKNDDAKLAINVANTAEISRVELNAPAKVEVNGGVSNILVAETAQGSSVTLKETATVATVAVNAGNITIESENATVNNVVVAESVKDTVQSNIEMTTVSKEEMDEHFAHQHILIIVSSSKATCTEAGKINYACECGETVEKTVPALGHNYTYSVTKEPSENEKGEGLYQCTRCDYKYTVEIDNYVSISFALDGLHAALSLIPDGTYTVYQDKPFKASQKNGIQITADSFNAVFEIRSGKLSGTGSGHILETENDGDTWELGVRAKIEDNIVYAYYNLEDKYGSEAHTGSGHYYYQNDYNLEGAVLVSLNALINMGLAEFLPCDSDELSEVMTYLEKLESFDASLPTDLFKRLSDEIMTTEKKDGNTVYTLSSEKLVALIKKIGEMTGAELFDEIVGEGTYKDICELVKGIADKTVLEVAMKLDDFTSKYGISQEDLLLISQAIVSIVLPEEVNVIGTIEDYYDKTVAEAVADIFNITEADVKDMIDENVISCLNMVEKSTVAELLDNVKEGFFGQLPEMIENYAQYVEFEFTLNSENKMIAFSLSYIDDNGIKVSIKKNVGSAIPAIDIDIPDYAQAKVEKTDNGAKITAEIMGATFTLTGEKTETGAAINMTFDKENVVSADVNVDVIVTNDSKNQIYGATFAFGGGFKIASLPEQFILNGSISLEKNGGKPLDTDVWNSFDGDKEALKHIDVTLYPDWYDLYHREYRVIRLKYMTDKSGEYYLLTKTEYESLGDGRLLERVYKTRLLSINGLPDTMLICKYDCADWLEMDIEHNARAEVTETMISGSIKDSDVGFTIENEVRGKSEDKGFETTYFYGTIFINTKTGKLSSKSMHDFEATGRYCEGSISCSGGIVVTKTCKTCNYTETVRQNNHYYQETQTVFDTQCGKTSLTEMGCVVCHDVDVRVSKLDVYPYNDPHSFSSSSKAIAASDLTGYGFNTEGFYHGSSILYYCSICGLNIYKYTYYTNSKADGCLKHIAYAVAYKGNVDYKSFEYKTEISGKGHYVRANRYIEYSSISAAIKEAESIIGGKMPFTASSAYHDDTICVGCNAITHKEIQLYNNNDRHSMQIYVDYNDGKVSTWSYSYRISDLQNVVAEAAKYGQQLEGATSGSVVYSVNSRGYNHVDIDLSHKYAEFKLYADTYSDNSGYMDVYAYYYKECKVYNKDYNLRNGKWILSYSSVYDRHQYVNDYVYGDNCKEDGYYYASGCRYCGDGADEINVMYSHKNTYSGGSYYTDYLTSDDISSLNAQINSKSYCPHCRTLIGVTIVLYDDWTLTNDVYLKAEGITIDLNGHSIDLNGYNLAIYSYAGRLLTLTDNTFDTSQKEDYTSKIDNSKALGILIVVSNGAVSDVRDNIIVGTIAIECEILASDSDDRYSLFDSLKEKEYELPFLKEERPYIPGR